MDQILKAGPKVFCKGSSDSGDPVVAHFLNRKSLERWFHSCICHCVPVPSWALCREHSVCAAFWEGPGWCLQCFCTETPILPQEMLQTTQNSSLLLVVLEIACLDLFHISYSPISLPCIFMFFKDLCQIIMEGNLKCIRGSGVFVYTNFFFTYSGFLGGFFVCFRFCFCIFFLQKRRKMTVFKEEKKFLSRIEMWSFKGVYPDIWETGNTLGWLVVPVILSGKGSLQSWVW